MAKDYYKILEIARNATGKDIKKTYRKLAMQYHPDRNPGKEEWANAKFKEINEAYAVLGDPEKRRQYDQFGTVGNIGDIFGSPHTRTTFENVMGDFGGAGLGFDFLDNIFGDFFKGSSFTFSQFGGRQKRPRRIIFEGPGGINFDDLVGQTQRKRQAPPGNNINYEITITAEQAVKGMEKDLTRKGKRLRVKIPAGVKDGSKIRLRKARLTTDAQPGDIIIRIKVNK